MAGCGDDGTGPADDPVVGFQIVPNTARLEPGDSLQLVAEFLLASGAIRVADDALWTSLEPSVASVRSDGMVHAVSAGRVEIEATAAGRSAQSAVTVPGWFAVAPLPEPRRAGHAAALAGKIYYIGGNAGPGEQYVASTFVYDPATDSWSRGADMPTARDQGATAVVAGEIHVIGGVNPNAPNNGLSRLWANEAYRPAADQWALRSSMPTARGGARADSLDGKIYVVAGTTVVEVYDRVEIYDPIADSWSLAPVIPTARHSFAIGSIDGKLYVAGGELESRGITPSLEVFDLDAGSWTLGPNMPTARLAVADAVLEGRLVVLGGSGPAGLSDVVEAYDPSAGRWYTLKSLLEARREARAVVVEGTLYLIGGVTRDGVSGRVDGLIP